MITKEQVIEFLKEQRIEDISEIWIEFAHEMGKRWKNGKKDSEIEELEDMFKGATKGGTMMGMLGDLKIPPPPPKYAPLAVSVYSTPLSSDIEFGFPIDREEKKLKVGKVYWKDSRGHGWQRGRISGGRTGLTILTKNKAISIRFENVERIEWVRGKKGGKKQNGTNINKRENRK